MAWVPFLGRFFPGHAECKDDHDLPAARVAVIGAGVGGCFATNFLRELGGQKLEIHVWNRKGSHVGGRTATTEFAGHTFETGASIMHSSNKYLVDAADKYGKQCTSYFYVHNILIAPGPLSQLFSIAFLCAILKSLERGPGAEATNVVS